VSELIEKYEELRTLNKERKTEEFTWEYFRMGLRTPEPDARYVALAANIAPALLEELDHLQGTVHNQGVSLDAYRQEVDRLHAIVGDNEEVVIVTVDVWERARAEREELRRQLAEANEWIPASERLPDDCRTTQFIFEPCFGEREFAHGHIESGSWYVVADGRKRKINKRIYCWRYVPNWLFSEGPLPAPLEAQS
jgi:hypothetical protein